MWSWARGPTRRRIPQAEQWDPASARQLGTAEMSGAGSGHGVRELQGWIQPGWLGCPSRGMQLADFGQGLWDMA